MCTYEQMPPTAKSAHNYMKHFVKQRFAGELLKANSCTSLSSTSRLYSDDCVYSDEPLYDDESAVLVFMRRVLSRRLFVMGCFASYLVV